MIPSLFWIACYDLADAATLRFVRPTELPIRTCRLWHGRSWRRSSGWSGPRCWSSTQCLRGRDGGSSEAASRLNRSFGIQSPECLGMSKGALADFVSSFSRRGVASLVLRAAQLHTSAPRPAVRLVDACCRRRLSEPSCHVRAQLLLPGWWKEWTSSAWTASRRFFAGRGIPPAGM